MDVLHRHRVLQRLLAAAPWLTLLLPLLLLLLLLARRCRLRARAAAVEAAAEAARECLPVPPWRRQLTRVPTDRISLQTY